MIRINLLKARGEVGGAFEPSIVGEAPDRRGAIIGGGLILAAFGLIAFQYVSAQGKLSELDEEIRQLTQEKTRLQAIITQVNEFQAKLKELEEKTELIERLTREREGPVRMLDDISAQLPDFVWLTALNQAASTVTIDGMAASYVSIADYIKKLEESEYFRNVELIDARQDREFTAFTIRSEVVTPRAASGTEPALAAGAAVTSR